MHKGKRNHNFFKTPMKYIIFSILLVFTLNALLSLFRWYPRYEFHLIFVPSIEVLMIFLITAGLTFVPKKTAAVLLAVPAFILAFYFLFAAGETFYQHAYKRNFVPWTDLVLVPPFFNMVFKTEVFDKHWVQAILAFLTIILSGLLFYGLLSALHNCIRAFPSFLHLMPAAAVFILPLFFGFGTPLTALAVRQLKPPSDEIAVIPDRAFLELDPAGDEEGTSPAGAGKKEYVFPRLKDRDLLLFIIESYGHTLFSNKAHYDLIGPDYREFEKRLLEHDFKVRSKFVISPAYGGRSWLADSTLLTGMLIDTQHKYNSVVHSKTLNLTHVMDRAGYFSLFSAPGTKFAEEDWKSFYYFDQYYFEKDFDYRGPYFSFGIMPDQYLIYETWKKHLALSRDRPDFVVFTLVSSHVPFRRVPPFIEDWHRIGDGSVYHDLPVLTFSNNWLTGGEYPEGYTASIQYVLKTVTDFIVNFIEDDTLIIIAGDHQPRFPISEREATFSVPVHVISKNAELIRSFKQFEYSYGLQPDRNKPHGRMENLLSNILYAIRGVDIQDYPFTK